MKFHNITKDDMINGDGVRVVLWVSGCEHRCEGCHNQITWDENVGLDFNQKAYEEIFAELDKSYVNGITLSGGDPLHHCNRCEITKLCEIIKQKYPQKTIWLYSGYLWENVKDFACMKNVDVMCDGRFIQSLLSPDKHWVGSSNQRVIDVKKSFETNSVVLHCE